MTSGQNIAGDRTELKFPLHYLTKTFLNQASLKLSSSDTSNWSVLIMQAIRTYLSLYNLRCDLKRNWKILLEVVSDNLTPRN